MYGSGIQIPKVSFSTITLSKIDTGNSLNPAVGISNLSLPTYLDYATASAAITVGAGGVTGTTYLYHDQTTNSIGAVRL